MTKYNSPAILLSYHTPICLLHFIHYLYKCWSPKWHNCHSHTLTLTVSNQILQSVVLPVGQWVQLTKSVRDVIILSSSISLACLDKLVKDRLHSIITPRLWSMSLTSCSEREFVMIHYPDIMWHDHMTNSTVTSIPKVFLRGWPVFFKFDKRRQLTLAFITFELNQGGLGWDTLPSLPSLAEHSWLWRR
jgi:hypothetical protein